MNRSTFHTIVFRGGAVMHIPSTLFDKVTRTHAEKGTVLLHMNDDDHLIDTAGIERILPFSVWMQSENTKLSGLSSPRRICSFGEHHSSRKECFCVQENRMPLSFSMAKSILEYASNPDNAELLEKYTTKEYIKSIAQMHSLPLHIST